MLAQSGVQCTMVGSSWRQKLEAAVTSHPQSREDCLCPAISFHTLWSPTHRTGLATFSVGLSTAVSPTQITSHGPTQGCVSKPSWVLSADSV